jgi:hypothetical protein
MDQLNLNDDVEFVEEPQITTTPRWMKYLLVVTVLASIFLYLRFQNYRSETDQAHATAQKLLDDFKQSTLQRDDGQQQQIDHLRADLDSQAEQLGLQAEETAATKREAQSYADKKAQLLTEQLNTQQQQNDQKFGQFSTAMNELGQKAETVHNRIAEVNNEVTVVRDSLAQTVNSLDQTRAELTGSLRKVQGDLGVTNGYVATNTQELAELKKLNERNYVQFTMNRQKISQKVGDFNLWLDKTDVRRNRFTLFVMVKDQLTEKRDRNVNEPLQFYVGHDLYEIVINSVTKTSITGYLSAPKNPNK